MSRDFLVPKWLKTFFHIFQKTVPSLVCDCHRSVHMLLSKAASHSLSHKTSLTSNNSFCILLPSDTTYSIYLHIPSVVRYVGFQGLFLQRMQWFMVHRPWTIQTVVSTSAFCWKLLDCLVLGVAAWFLDYCCEKIQKLLVKNAVVGLLFACKTKCGIWD